MSDYLWKPIEPLSEEDLSVDIAGNQSLYESWATAKERLGETAKNQANEFTDKLIRRLSIETGVLERLYDLDRGTTEALVQHGFVEDIVSHATTNISPSSLMDYLIDQQAAIQLVMDVIGRSRPLSKSVIHELHSILTRHQETSTAIDQFERRREIPLLKGKFKEQPNNPRRPDGSMHEYCPPIQVESEMDRLLEMFHSYDGRDPVLVSAWIHHRFTQIHPYQDGNGRLARVIVTMVLLQKKLLPVVIDRDIRTDYLDALEKADSGNLSPLVRLFAKLEQNAILQALSIDTEVEVRHQQSLTSAVIESLAQKFNRRKERRSAELLKVNDHAIVLRGQAEQVIEKALQSFRSAFSSIGTASVAITNDGPNNSKSYWYRNEVIRTAQAFQKFANFDQNHYFTQGSLRLIAERFKFVVSFHHVGTVLNGIMEATAFAKIQFDDEAEGLGNGNEEFLRCSVEPFVFTYLTDINSIADSFANWLDGCLAIALKDFGDRL